LTVAVKVGRSLREPLQKGRTKKKTETETETEKEKER